MKIKHFEFVKKEKRSLAARSAALRRRLISEIWFSLFELQHTNMLFCISETKSATQPKAYMHVFATLKTENLCFPNPKFKAVCHLLLQNMPVWVRTGTTRPTRFFFSKTLS